MKWWVMSSTTVMVPCLIAFTITRPLRSPDHSTTCILWRRWNDMLGPHQIGAEDRGLMPADFASEIDGADRPLVAGAGCAWGRERARGGAFGAAEGIQGVVGQWRNLRGRSVPGRLGFYPVFDVLGLNPMQAAASKLRVWFLGYTYT